MANLLCHVTERGVAAVGVHAAHHVSAQAGEQGAWHTGAQCRIQAVRVAKDVAHCLRVGGWR